MGINMSEKKPIRILQIVSSLNAASGVLAVVLNWHRHFDTSKIQFDYLYTLETPVTNKIEIEKLGGNCYNLPHPYKQPFKFLMKSYRFFKEHHYNTVHSHITNLNLFFYPLAKMFGTKNIIQHAHGTKWSDKKFGAIRNYLMLHAVWPFITHKLACSQKAGEMFFGKNFQIVKNGIDVEKFAYNTEIRNIKRKELNLENNFVIGHVGRFSGEKNHKYLIYVFKQVVEEEQNARLLLIGNGYLENEIRAYVRAENLQDKVIFLGARKDVAELYQAMDVFVLPSLHEGMPVSAIEAQCAGLPCIFADTITKEVLILPESKMLSLKNLPRVWADEILKYKGYKRNSGVQYLKIKGFDIKDIGKKIESLYNSLEC